MVADAGPLVNGWHRRIVADWHRIP